MSITQPLHRSLRRLPLIEDQEGALVNVGLHHLSDSLEPPGFARGSFTSSWQDRERDALLAVSMSVAGFFIATLAAGRLNTARADAAAAEGAAAGRFKLPRQIVRPGNFLRIRLRTASLERGLVRVPARSDGSLVKRDRPLFR